MVMANLSRSIGNLAKMRLRGFGLSMDDYGTGYSSMKQLSRCPFTELKIDRSFVDRAADKPNLRAILASAVEMAAKLNLSSVGEGVERIDDMRVLCEVGCDVAQGYLVARPMPGEMLLDWYKENRDRFREEWRPIRLDDT
jgi:EAL domain-containing protein (putative c-di-GMP-specific phosphodiesterase class I)